MNIDKRKYTRFLAQDDTFAALEPVAVAVAAAVGKLKDISMGGLAFEYINIAESSNQIFSHRDISKPLQVSIFLPKNKFYLCDVPCKVIYDDIAPVSVDYQEFLTSLKPRWCGVKFERLSEDMMRKLEFFLKNYATEPLS